MIWTIGGPIAIIVVLEILQQISDSKLGILDVNESSTIARSAGRILTSFVMILVAMSYDSVEFTILTFSPYFKLERPSTISASSLLPNGVGHIPLYTIWKSLRRGNLLGAIASIAATLGSLLTIIASRLYAVEIVTYPQQPQLSFGDHFISQGRNTSQGSPATVNFDLLEHQNGTYPPYTFEELVFPRLSADSRRLVQTSNSTTLEMSIPARRAALNCTVVPRENVKVSFEDVEPSIYNTRWETYYDFVAEVPSTCPEFRNLSNVLTDTIPFSIFGAYDNGTNPAATKFNAASLLNLANFWQLDSSTDFPKDWSGVGAASNSPQCPSLGLCMASTMNSRDRLIVLPQLCARRISKRC
jgi:Protein of unknown function (DUF3433)